MHEPAILPEPRHLVRAPGATTLGPATAIACSPGAEHVASLVRALLSPATGFPLANRPSGAPRTSAGARDRSADTSPLDASGSDVVLELDPSLARLGPEGYRLVVDADAVRLAAAGTAGLRNAAQTLRQLLDPAIFRRAAVRGADWALPHVVVEDSPTFPWRGAHLDVSRHFMPAHFLYRFVDLLALHKLNVLHLHLTDDQGWRFPSATYPRLTEVGSWRAESMLGHARAGRFDGTPHGGSYSRAELVDLVAYAAERNITVMPEIDLPGHTQAAIAAYPFLGNLADELGVWTRWGVSEHVLNVEDAALDFCRTLLGELLDVFPSRYVHVGGDECPKSEWRASASAQRRIAALGLAGEDALQGWFTAELGAFLAGAGRSLVGWDEILEGGTLPTGATVMSWRGTSGGLAAARAGFDVVMCPEAPCYFDHYQSDDPREPLAIHGCNTLADVYGYEPVPADLEGDAAGHVLGSQLQLWTEYLPEPADVEYMAFPRAAALAEVTWSGPGRDLARFTDRLGPHLARLDELGVNYRPLAGPQPWQEGGTGARRRP
ncbi:MAG: beta-N-acetylhexosaminidase [Acidimicrobiales bacterium]